MSDFEPVEIDFVYGGNTATEGPKIEQSMQNIAEAGKKAIEETQQKIRDTKSNIAQIESDLKNLQKSFDKAAPGNQKEFFGLELNAAKKALQEEKNILTELEGRVETTAKSHGRLRTQIMEAKDALAKMEMAGKRGTAEYRAMAAELGRLNDQMGDTNSQARILADDEKGFKAVASGVSGVAGAMSAATGVAALMGAENEELAKIQTRLQAVMAITIGLQEVARVLNKDSYFSVVLLTKAKLGWAAANLKVATTLGISTVAAKALMATLTLGLSVAIIAIVSVIDKLIQKNKDQKRTAEEALKAQKEEAQKTAEEYAKEIAKVETLRAALNSENVSRNQKLGIVKKLKEIMPGYNVELDKEGKLIRENKKAVDEYMQSVDKSIRLKAEEKELSALFSKKYELEKKTFKRPVARSITESNMLDVQEAAFNKFMKQEIAKVDQKISIIKNRISSGGLVGLDQIFGEDEKDEPKVPDKPKKEAYDAAKAIQKLLLDVNKQTSDLLFAQRQDSFQKTLDEIDREKDAEIAKIKEKEQEIIDKYNTSNKEKKGSKAVSSISQIDPKLALENEAAIKALEDAYKAKRTAEEKKYLDDMTKMAAEAADERVKIQNDYESQIIAAREAGFENYAKLLELERDKKKSDMTAAIITESEAYKLATNDQLIISKETTEKLINLIKQRVAAELAAGQLTKEQAKEILDSIDATGASSGSSNNPFSKLIDGLNEYKKAKESLNKMKATASPQELAKLEDAANYALQSTAAAAGLALSGVRDVLNSAVQGLDQLGLLNEEQKKGAQEIIGMVSGAANLAMGIATGNPIQIIQGSIELLVNAISFFDFETKKLEKAQKQHLKNVEELERKYQKLQRAVEKALGTDVYAAQKASIENSKKQIEEYEAWLEAERKKKKKKQDADAIADTEAKIEALKNSIEDETKAIIESLAQTNVKDLATQLSDALVEAFQSGESAALAMGDVVNNVLRNAVINALKLKILDKLLAPAIDQFAADMESGDGLTNSEADRFRKSVEAAGEAYFKALNEANDALGGIFTADSAKSAGITGDVAKMTEQTGSALVGQLTAMRLNVALLLSNSKSSIDSLGKMLAALENIKSNTDRLNRIDDTLYYFKQNGLKML